MKRYSIGQVCEALGVKPHIVRYWEQEIGILSPDKDRGGRRSYTESDLQLLFRIKYLIHERKYTVKGAAMRIVEESVGTTADVKARIREVRGELLGLLGRVRAHELPQDRGDSADIKGNERDETEP